MILQDPVVHVVEARKPFPADKEDGILFGKPKEASDSMQLIMVDVTENSWASNHTDLKEYASWQIVKLNKGRTI